MSQDAQLRNVQVTDLFLHFKDFNSESSLTCIAKILFLEDNVLSQNKVTFYQPDLEKSVTQIYIHTLFSDFAVDPTLPCLFGTAALAFQCPNSDDLEPMEICNKQLQVLEEGEWERWGGYFISLR